VSVRLSERDVARLAASSSTTPTRQVNLNGPITTADVASLVREIETRERDASALMSSA